MSNSIIFSPVKNGFKDRDFTICAKPLTKHQDSSAHLYFLSYNALFIPVIRTDNFISLHAQTILFP